MELDARLSMFTACRFYQRLGGHMVQPRGVPVLLEAIWPSVSSIIQPMLASGNACPEQGTAGIGVIDVAHRT